LLLPQIEQALGTLVVRGLVTADAFSPLRWLIRPEAARRRQLKAAQRHASFSAADMLGRWSAVRFVAEKPEVPNQDELASLCTALLRRYGVVFRAVLERESLAPPWRHLLRYLRRMEDRGEVHGGRFVDGFSGEQFALAEAVGLLRQHSRVPEQHQLVVIGASDPLNLGGLITPGVRTAAVNGHRILLCDGVPLARMQGEVLEVLDEHGMIPMQQIQRRLSNVHELLHGGTGGH
jgi:ATP-dependent Lhr-like helicase